MTRILYRGTLGDSFIIFCKLINLTRDAEFELQRYSDHKQFDEILVEFYSRVPKIHYKTPCKSSEMFEKDLKTGIFLNVGCGKDSFNGPFDDPAGFEMEPYPKYPLKKIKSDSKVIGIQLHSGKLFRNYKAFHLSFIKKLVLNGPKDVHWRLFGTGEGYNLSQINRLCRQLCIENLVAKTSFSEWLRHLKSVDLLITPEGFSAFFALSQKIPCYVYYTQKEDLVRFHPEWMNHLQLEEVQSRISLPDLLRINITQRINPSFKVLDFVWRVIQ
jgi:hypothetical protein